MTWITSLRWAGSAVRVGCRALRLRTRAIRCVLSVPTFTPNDVPRSTKSTCGERMANENARRGTLAVILPALRKPTIGLCNKKSHGPFQHDFGAAIEGDLGHARLQRDLIALHELLAVMEHGRARLPTQSSDLRQRGNDVRFRLGRAWQLVVLSPATPLVVGDNFVGGRSGVRRSSRAHDRQSETSSAQRGDPCSWPPNMRLTRRRSSAAGIPRRVGRQLQQRILRHAGEPLTKWSISACSLFPSATRRPADASGTTAKLVRQTSRRPAAGFQRSQLVGGDRAVKIAAQDAIQFRIFATLRTCPCCANCC